MKYILDTHTHTLASGHAYTTLLENVQEAAKNGIKVLATTDHGPNMPGGPHLFHIASMRSLPRTLYGVTLLHGCEANIIDYDGNLDLPERVQERVDILIASLHDVCITPGNRDENTKAIIRAMENPCVDIIGHCGNPAFPIWEEEVVKKAKENNILIEINNSSLLGGSRIGSEKNCIKIAKLCKDYKVNIAIGSDAHHCFAIGNFLKAEELLKEVGMPESLIMNIEEQRIIRYLKNKGKLNDINLDSNV